MNATTMLTLYAMFSAAAGVIGFVRHTRKAMGEYDMVWAMVNYGLWGFCVYAYRPTQVIGLVALIVTTIPQAIARVVATNGVGGTSAAARAFDAQMAKVANAEAHRKMKKAADAAGKQVKSELDMLKGQLRNSSNLRSQLEMMLDALAQGQDPQSIARWYKGWKSQNAPKKESGQNNQANGQNYGQPNRDEQDYYAEPVKVNNGAVYQNRGNGQYSAAVRVNNRPVSPAANRTR